MQGASATEQLLREVNDPRVRVFVVWEPVLATDFSAPSTAALARISDPRGEQYWDSKRDLSHLMGEHDGRSVVWDHIAVYAPGPLWQDALPPAVYARGPVKDVIAGAKQAVQQLLANDARQGGG